MNDNLPELRDIHIPEGVSAFPPAYGWFVILGAAALSYLLCRLFICLRKKSEKLFALRLIKEINTRNNIVNAVKMSEILRRICVYKYKEAVTLFGRDWINFLNRHSKNKLGQKSSELLINAPYIPENTKKYNANDVEELREFCKNWIKENL